MKSLLILSMLVCGIVNSLFSQHRLVQHPAFEFRATGIYQIEKIESSDSETRVHVLCRFIPGWWVNFSNETFIRPSGSEDKLLISGMVGGTIGEQITMPASGDSAVVLIFPAVPPNTRAIDFAEDGKPVIFGLSLTQSQPLAAQTTEIPKPVQRWIEEALAESNVKEPVVYGTDAFFSRDTARLVGYIKGYDPRAGFSTGMIYAGNDLTREDHPMVVDVYEDGRFEARIPMLHPIHTYVAFERRVIPFYIEPGQTLSMVLDWQELLEADRMRNRPYKFKLMVFGGPLAQLNDELRQWGIPHPDYLALEEKKKHITPADFKREQMLIWEEAAASLAVQLAQQNLLPNTKALLRSELSMSHARQLFEFLSGRGYYAQQDPTNDILKAPVGDDYYDFLQKLQLDDPILLATRDFSTFINRFEYCDVFNKVDRQINAMGQPGKSWQSFLFEELGLSPSEEDQEFLALDQSIFTSINNGGMTDAAQQELLKRHQEKAGPFFERYAEQMKAYHDKYIATLQPVTPGLRATAQWHIKDSLLQHNLGLEPSFAYEVAKIRSLAYTFENQFAGQKDNARVFLTELENGISHPFLLSEAERLFHAAYPDQPKQAYELPEGRGTALFKQLTDPHKGKFVFVDFWATTCGPCIASIKQHKQTREKYRNNPDFEFVFITSTNESPQQSYDDFIAEQELAYTHRLSADDFRLLRQLFKFNGIPRYVVIDPDGRVLNDDFPMHNFLHELKRILASRATVAGPV